MRWLKDHSNNEGNDKADKRAKAAARDLGPESRRYVTKGWKECIVN